MKKYFTILLGFITLNFFSQTKAVTEDGKEVILLDNGTWKFVNESDEKTLQNIETNNTIFEKAKDATFLLKSKKLDLGIYYNPKKWQVKVQRVSPYVEYFFQEPNSESSVSTMFLTEKIKIATLKNLKDVVIMSLQKNTDYFRIKKSEYRTVNGLKVLYLSYIANNKGIDFEYCSNYYLNEDGYCGVTGFATQNEFEKNSEKLHSFINGLVQAEKAVTTETVEYTSPPPPMR